MSSGAPRLAAPGYVRRGTADWESFIRGRDGRGDLLSELVATAQREFGDEAEAAMAASEAPEDMEDPRPRRGRKGLPRSR